MHRDGPEHKLVAILAADIVGYSLLTEIDQSGTHGQLLAHRKEVTDPAIAEHGGRIFTTAGDGFLVEFASALNAVQCAVAIQGDMERRNVHVPEDSRIVFRVGVNLGDVIVEKDGLYGTGVNIAARLESICEPGGVLISGKVHDEVRDKLNLTFDDRGSQKVKNMAEPVRTYSVNLASAADTVAGGRRALSAEVAGIARFKTPAFLATSAVILAIVGAVAWQATRTPTVEAAVVENMAFPLPDKPSIAVLAFDNLGTDANDGFLADSLSEDIVTSLSKLSGLFVISRTTSFTYKGKDVTAKQVAEDLGVRFVLEGSLQRDGDRIRVTTQLIDSIGGQHVWAERYDRDLNDLFAVKYDITLNIVSNISAELVAGERDRVLRRETESLEAWLLYKQGFAALEKGTREPIELARYLFERVLAIDPDFVAALAMLGNTHVADAFLMYTETPQDSYDKGLELIDRALEMDPNHAYATSSMAIYYSIRGRIDLAVELGQRAVDLDPNDYETRAGFGQALFYAGRPDDAVREFLLALRLSPVAAEWIPLALADAYVYSGKYGEAVAEYERELDRPPSSTFYEWWARLNLALALDALGREDEARAQLALAVEVSPGLSTITARRADLLRFEDQNHSEDRRATFRRLGMPEG